MSREIHSFSPEVEKGAENQVAAVGSIQAEEDAREAEAVGPPPPQAPPAAPSARRITTEPPPTR